LKKKNTDVLRYYIKKFKIKLDCAIRRNIRKIKESFSNNFLKQMKSLNKASLILLIFLIAFNLIFCIKPSDFCGLKQKLDECQGLFSYKCGSDVCAKNITDCNLFLQMNSYLILLLKIKLIDTKQVDKYKLESKKILTFNKHVKKCDIKYRVRDFCLNGRNCTEKKLSNTKLGYKYVTYEADCKCPESHIFSCGKYCSSSFESCNYFKSNEKISKNFKKISKCGNQKMSSVMSTFFSWQGK